MWNKWLACLAARILVLIFVVPLITVFTYSVNGTADFGDEPKKINSMLQVIFFNVTIKLQFCTYFPGSKPHGIQWDLHLSRHVYRLCCNKSKIKFHIPMKKVVFTNRAVWDHIVAMWLLWASMNEALFMPMTKWLTHSKAWSPLPKSRNLAAL